MKREEYNACMSPYMKGGGEDRKLRFCIGAKVCSSKAKNEEEARQICLSAPAKEPKQRKARSKSKIDAPSLSACIIEKIDGSEITLANLTTIIADCTGQKVGKPLTREKFIKKCFKENAITGDIKESQKLRSLCTAKWKEREEEGGS